MRIEGLDILRLGRTDENEDGDEDSGLKLGNSRAAAKLGVDILFCDLESGAFD